MQFLMVYTFFFVNMEHNYSKQNIKKMRKITKRPSSWDAIEAELRGLDRLGVYY